MLAGDAGGGGGDRGGVWCDGRGETCLGGQRLREQRKLGPVSENQNLVG
jgi:hypothetical protein